MTNEELVKVITSKLDENSLIVQKDRDSGDQAYRSGIFAFLLFAIDHSQAKDYYEIMKSHLEAMPGIWRRSGNPKHWGYNPNNLSRDQAASLMLAATVNNDNEACDEFYAACHNRESLAEVPDIGPLLVRWNNKVGFHQNIHPGTDAPASFRKCPDVVGIGEHRNEIRRKNEWWKYPWLMILDFGFLVDLYLRKNQTNDFDSLYAKDLIFANIRIPTMFSWLAKKFYKRTDYVVRLRDNYSEAHGKNGNEALGELYVQVCERYIT